MLSDNDLENRMDENGEIVHPVDRASDIVETVPEELDEMPPDSWEDHSVTISPDWTMDETPEGDGIVEAQVAESQEIEEGLTIEDKIGSQSSEEESPQKEKSTSHPLADQDKPSVHPSVSMKDPILPDKPAEPIASVRFTPQGDLNLIKVFLRSTGDRKRDTLRMRRVYGLLTTYHGIDRFSVFIFEGSRRYHLEFPNDTTGYCPELYTQLCNLVGDANVKIEPLRLQ
jgi:hypothetical protein